MANSNSTPKPGISRTENRLTDTALRKTKLPESGKLPVNDGGGIRGILTIAAGRRVARLSFHFQINRKSHELYLGTWPDTGLAEMRSKRDQARTLARQGTNPIEAFREEKAAAERAKAEEAAARAEAEVQAAARLTVKKTFEKWEALHLSRAYKDGGQEVRRIFEKDVFPSLGELAIEELNRRHIAAVVDGALERDAPRSAQMLLVYLRQLCRWSVTRGYLETDPSAVLAKSSIKVNAPRERVLSDEEVRALAKILPQAGLPPWAPPAIWMLLATAARVGELLNARWSDFDLKQGEWLIPADHAKNKRAHIVDLSDFALARLEELAKLRTGPWLITGRPSTREDAAPKPIDDKALARQLKDRQRPEGFVPLKNRTATHNRALILPGGDWTPHDLRRSAATFMQGLGILPAIIEKCLNHTEQNRMVAVYQRHDYRPERKDAFNRLGHHLEELAKGKPGKVISLQRRA